MPTTAPVVPFPSPESGESSGPNPLASTLSPRRRWSERLATSWMIASLVVASIPLLLGSYVKVDIEAGNLAGVLTIPRSALREGNRLWLVGSDNLIRIAEPEILWTRPQTVLVPNILKEGERLVVSELKVALPGMEVDPQPLDAADGSANQP